MVASADFDFTLDQVADALSYVNCEHRDTWLKMAMAVKVGFGDAGFDVWNHWSAGGSTYKEKNALTVWKSVKLSGRSSSVTLGTLIHEAKQAGYKLQKESLSPDQKRERAEVAEARKKEYLERARLEAIEIEKNHKTVASFAQLLWSRLSASGSSPYLDMKKVRSFGLRFVNQAIVIVNNENPVSLELITGGAAVTQFFDTRDPDLSFHYYKKGTVVVPVKNIDSEIINLQFITPIGTKKFLKWGRKETGFHVLGNESTNDYLGVVEGYSTGASVHMATGIQVAVAFDSGNILPVAEALSDRYGPNLLIFFGDDDVETDGNPGRTKAEYAASQLGGVALFPDFSDKGID